MIQVVLPQWMNPRGRKALNAFAYGLGELGLDYDVLSLKDAYPSDEPMVFWGVFKNKLKERRKVQQIQFDQKRAGGELVIIERGFVKRDEYYMVSWDDINGRGRYPEMKNCPPDRWDQLEVPLRSWQPQGRQILVMGQVPWDTACQHVNHQKWVVETCATLKRTYPRHKLVFRPHPLQPNAVTYTNKMDYVDLRRTLESALAQAKVVVTFSSNTGVDATIAGVPVIACDRTSMVYGLCPNNPRSTKLRHPTRLNWAFSLAYKQWTLAEMAQGLPWLHLHEER